MMAVFVTAYLRSVELLLVFGTTLYCISNACQTCNSRWEKIYERDATGNAVWGDQTELIDAHLEGAKIKYITLDFGEAGLLEELDQSFVTDGELCGMSLFHMFKDDWDHFVDDGRLRFVQVCTTSMIPQYDQSVGSADFYSLEVHFSRVVWYVQKSTCPLPVYHNTAFGADVSGSKDELKNAVMSGQEIKIKLDFLMYVIPMNHIEISPINGEVIGHESWSISFSDSVKWWTYRLTSSGLAHYQAWTMGEHIMTTNSIVQRPMQWMVEPCWRHSFTHDENGVEQDGSLVDLIAAVEQGHRVRVLTGTSCSEVNNLRIKDRQVSGQILNEMSRDETNPSLLIDDTFWIWHMVHTTGTVRTRRYNIGGTTNRGDSIERRTVSWFVDTHPWKKVLSTNKLGIATFGSKADLKHALENGASVGIGLQFDQGETHGHGDEWFYMRAGGIEFGPTGEIAAEFFRSVSTEEVGGGEFQIKDNPFWKVMLVTTQGNVDIAQWRVGDHINDGHFSDTADVNWFVSY